jgi:hypothetical protein
MHGAMLSSTSGLVCEMNCWWRVEKLREWKNGRGKALSPAYWGEGRHQRFRPAVLRLAKQYYSLNSYRLNT